MFDSVEQTIAQFLDECEARGHSPNTIAAYRGALGNFRAFLELKQVTALSQLAVPHIREYSLLCAKQLALGGAHARLRPVKTYLKWVHAEEIIAQDVTKRMVLPKLPRDEQPAVRLEDYRKLKAIAKVKSRQPARDVAILAVLFDTGIRASELASLRMEDVKPEGFLVIKQGKGGKSRTVPMENSTFKLIRLYYTKERDNTCGSPFLFLAGDRPITRRTLDKMLARTSEFAGLPRLSAHAFRRGFAVQFIKNGGDVFTLQRIFGHTTLEMSNRYAHMIGDDLKDIHRKASPVRVWND